MFAFLLSLAVYAVNILIAQLLFKPEERVEKFSLVFSNAGFLGIPLVTGLLGIEAVFYLAPVSYTHLVFAGFHHKILQRARFFHAGVGFGDKAAN